MDVKRTERDRMPLKEQRKMAENHAESKHPKHTFAQCFPNIDAQQTVDVKQTAKKTDKKKSKTCAK